MPCGATSRLRAALAALVAAGTAACAGGDVAADAAPADTGWSALLAEREAIALALTEPIAACVARHDTDHPAFHGCVDWHSSVHGVWALVDYQLMTGDDRHRALVDETLDGQALARELADIKARPGFEMPYGRAWFLRLASDYKRAGGDTRLDALASEIVASFLDRYAERAPNPTAPEYSSDAWALVNLVDYARKTGDAELEATVSELARAHFMAPGETCPLTAEEKGFIAVCATWAWLVSKVAAPDEFAAWLAGWDPGIADLAPVESFASAHDYGRNFSRAWALHDLYAATGDERFLTAYVAHVEAGYRDPARWRGGYMTVAHWVAQFGMLALEPLFAADAVAAPPPVFKDVRALYPEGPTTRDGAVYWAEMNADRVRRWRDGAVETVWTRGACGPTAVETAPDGGFWILCHLDDRLVRVNADFDELFDVAITTPNDASPDGAGGVFVSSAGVFSLKAPAAGRVLHVDASGRAHVVLTGLRYANGVAFDPETGRLYVSEHLNRRVWRAETGADLDAPVKATAFFDLNAAGLDHDYPLAGPDGLLLTPGGGFIVAEYGEGRFLRVGPEGALLGTVAAPGPFVTNLVFAPWNPDELVVTASFTNTRLVNEGVVAAVRWR